MFARAASRRSQRFGELVEPGRDDGAFRSDVPRSWQVGSMLALIHTAAEEVRAGSISAEEAGRILVDTVPGLLSPAPADP